MEYLKTPNRTPGLTLRKLDVEAENCCILSSIGFSDDDYVESTVVINPLSICLADKCSLD